MRLDSELWSVCVRGNKANSSKEGQAGGTARLKGENSNGE